MWRASGGRPERGFSPVTPKFEWSTKTRNGKTFRTGQTHQPRQAEGTVAEGRFRRPGIRESLPIGARKHRRYAYWRATHFCEFLIFAHEIQHASVAVYAAKRLLLPVLAVVPPRLKGSRVCYLARRRRLRLDVLAQRLLVPVGPHAQPLQSVAPAPGSTENRSSTQCTCPAAARRLRGRRLGSPCATSGR